jgi:hypothetical protein
MWYRIKSRLEAHIETHLVDDWRQVHRWYSARAAAAGVALITVWEALPGSMRDFLPHWLGAAVAYCTIAAVIAGRLTRQDIDQRTHSAPPKDGDGGAP